jgi:hypothetical protein
MCTVMLWIGGGSRTSFMFLCSSVVCDFLNDCRSSSYCGVVVSQQIGEDLKGVIDYDRTVCVAVML